MQQLSRTRLLFGEDAMEKLKKAHVAIFGLGGVGGYALEALARSGIGALTLVDHDTISETNLNRQILAAHSTIGMDKVTVAAQRIRDIDPTIAIDARKVFYSPESDHLFAFSQFSYVIDAIDTVTGKLCLVQQAQRAGVPIISSMGTGNKRDPSAFRIGDIYETSVCPLARVMRKECRKRGIPKLKVLYSLEEPITPSQAVHEELPQGRRSLPASCAYVPSVAGLLIAGAVIEDLLASNDPRNHNPRH